MRVVFLNPHTNIWFKKPVYYYLTKRRSMDKYQYLMDYCIKNNVEFAFMVDGSDFSFGRSYFRGSFLARIELMIWCKINKLNPFKIKILSDYKKLKESDVLFSFLYGNLVNIFEAKATDRQKVIDGFKDIKAFKVVHLTHYMYNASQGSKNTEEAGVDLFVAENNLSKNSAFFKKYYTWYKKDVLNIPFVPQERFKSYTPFKERKNRVIATGTLPAKMTDKDFVAYAPSGDIHPMRRLIHDNKGSLTDFIDSLISEGAEGKSIAQASRINVFRKVYNKIYKNFFVKQTNYFSFNIVESYNSYRMFIVPEEINDLPGIGFVEGMACGAVYIGKRDPMYSDLGMIENHHYIAYNGTLDDLKEKIKFYQSHERELEQIAINSHAFIRELTNPSTVCEDFFSAIKVGANERTITKKI